MRFNNSFLVYSNFDVLIDNRYKNDICFLENDSSGYLYGDFNMNGDVDEIDKNSFWTQNTGKSSQVPD